MKDIPGYEGLYSITEDGKVWSHARKRNIGYGGQQPYGNCWRKNVLSNHGYYTIGLTNSNGKCKSHYIHRLVAEAYIPNPRKLKTVNHKNGIKTDNRVANLEWCSMKDNLRHAFRTGLIPPRKGRRGMANEKARLTDVQVIEIRRLYATGDYTIKKLGLMYGISWQAIGDITARRHWTHI